MEIALADRAIRMTPAQGCLLSCLDRGRVRNQRLIPAKANDRGLLCAQIPFHRLHWVLCWPADARRVERAERGFEESPDGCAIPSPHARMRLRSLGLFEGFIRAELKP